MLAVNLCECCLLAYLLAYWHWHI